MKLFTQILFAAAIIKCHGGLRGTNGTDLDSYPSLHPLMEKVVDLVAFGTSHNDRGSRVLQTGDLFANYCSIIESTGEFECDCDDASTTATCVSQDVCSGDVCASFEIETDFDTQFYLQSIRICVDYDTLIELSQFRDGCVSLNYADNGSTVTSCEIEFKLFTNKLVPCNSCKVCNSGGVEQGFAIDCSNIEENASTEGCYVVEEEDQSSFFPGFRSANKSTSGALSCFSSANLIMAGMAMGMTWPLM